MAKIHVSAVVACALLLQGAACLPAQAQQTGTASEGSVATYQFDNQLKLMSEQRTRGISDSLLRPSATWSTQFVHASGLVALLEVAGSARNSSSMAMAWASPWPAVIASAIRTAGTPAWAWPPSDSRGTLHGAAQHRP